MKNLSSEVMQVIEGGDGTPPALWGLTSDDVRNVIDSNPKLYLRLIPW